MNAISDELEHALANVPAGRWGVAVSGGADSVALLRLTLLQPHLQLHVIHLDHETRAGASGEDAGSVRSLADKLDLPISIARLSEVDTAKSYNNPAARYRAARFAWFGIVTRQFGLQGVLLAHHADDQAETVAQRLLRGRQPAGLHGISADTTVDGVRLLRPLLGVSRDALREFLYDIDQSWVEDASNDSPAYQRNRVRRAIADHVLLRAALLNLGSSATGLAEWLDRSSPTLAAEFDAGELAGSPPPLARHAAARWLRDRGVSSEDLSPAVCDRLIALAVDFSGPARADFPGSVTVRRARGRIFAQPIPTKSPQQMEPISVNRSVDTRSSRAGRSIDE